jgi:hypothetical protein
MPSLHKAMIQPGISFLPPNHLRGDQRPGLCRKAYGKNYGPAVTRDHRKRWIIPPRAAMIPIRYPEAMR